MTPIQRVTSKSQAFQTLGVSMQATRSDIRSAYRTLAFKKHPDRSDCSSEEFSRITNAYQFLNQNADDLGITDDSKSKGPARPSVEPSETEFSAETIQDCTALLEQAAGDLPGHVATRLYRKGRSLTYFVPGAPLRGGNVIAVPTGQLIDSRRTHPQVIQVDTTQISAGVYDVPAEVCAKNFPGARSVKIRFGG